MCVISHIDIPYMSTITHAFRALRNSTTALQTAWRRRVCMRTYQSMMQYRRDNHCVVIVQKIVRRRLVLCQISRAKNAVQRLQSAWRQTRRMRVAKQWWSTRRRASTTICVSWKYFQLRRAKQYQARLARIAIVVQALVRGWKARSQHKLCTRSATKIQRLVRSRQASHMYYQFRKAIICLQTLARKRKVQNRFDSLRQATLVLQRRCRERQRMLIVHRHAVLSLQRVWRGHHTRTSHAKVIEHLQNFVKMLWLSKFKTQAVKVIPELFEASQLRVPSLI